MSFEYMEKFLKLTQSDSIEKGLKTYIESISGADEYTVKEATKRQSSLAKPLGSFGKIEDISIKLAGITGKVKNEIKKPVVIIGSSDNGVISEGVTATPQSVTMAQTINFTKRVTGIGALAKHFGIDLCVLDMGVNFDFPQSLTSRDMKDFTSDKIIDRKIAFGTNNLNEMDSMSRQEAIKAIVVGIEAVENIKELGYDIVGTGEMGIGNTTTSAAVLVALTDADIDIAVGRGGGLSDEGLCIKKDIVLNRAKNREFTDTIDILSKVGGFDICALVGVFLGCAKNRLPVVIDGYISSVAALAAKHLCETVVDFMFSSHISAESGYKIAMENIGISGILDLDMRLGEGTGCPFAFEVIKGATYVMNSMATFDEAQIDENYLELMKDAKY